MTTVAQTSTIHTVRGGGGLRLHVREWAGRTGHRSCSSTACRGRRPSPPPRRNGVTTNTPNSTRYDSKPALGQLRSVT
jgi:hypothetical protein